MSEQKMREAFASLAKQGYMIGWNDFQTGWEAAEEALAAPAGEQVGLTDAEVRAAFAKAANPNLMWPETVVAIGRAVIAAHEAKRASCSQTAKKSTCGAGRVDGISKSEHVGGAA